MIEKAATEKDLHPIQVVARRTGLTPDTLRAWEKRYQAVQPSRTPTGRRLYSDQDIERLRLLRQATLGGRGIRHVANLPTEELRAMVAEDEEKAIAPVGGLPARTSRASRPDDSSAALVDKAMVALERLEPRELENLLSLAQISLSRPQLLDEFLVPLLLRVGDGWRDGNFRIAHEHLATSVIRSFLGQLSGSAPAASEAPVMLATTPAGQVHELGLLMAAAVAASEGWNVLYLGPNMPAEDIAAAAIQKEVRVVALSLVYPPDDPRLADELRTLRRHLPDGTEMILGGKAAKAYEDALPSTGCVFVSDLQVLRDRLEQLRSPA